MGNVLVSENSLQNMADAIREKGGTGSYKPSQMADAIKSVYDAGIKKETALFSSYRDNTGVTYTTLWDVLQDKGSRTDYNHLFVKFTDKSFKPIYDIFPEKATSMFECSKITDLAALLDNAGVAFNLSMLTSVPYRTFAFSTITRCPSLLLPDSLNLNCTFYDCKDLETVEGLRVFVNNKFNLTFFGCTSLKNIKFEDGSEIGNNISFQYSPLSRKSIENIIGALSDNVSGKTLTLKKSAVADAFPYFNESPDVPVMIEENETQDFVFTCYVKGEPLDLGDGNYDYYVGDVAIQGKIYPLYIGHNEIAVSYSGSYNHYECDFPVEVINTLGDISITQKQWYHADYYYWNRLIESKPKWSISLV